MKILPCLVAFVALTFALCASGEGNPVSYRVLSSTTAEQPQDVVIAVVLEVQKGWHIYTPAQANIRQGVIPTRIEFDILPAVRDGPLVLPQGKPKGTFEVFTGSDLEFVQKLHLPDGFDRKVPVRGSITYQACTAEFCLPSRTVTFSVALVPISHSPAGFPADSHQ